MAKALFGGLLSNYVTSKCINIYAYIHKYVCVYIHTYVYIRIGVPGSGQGATMGWLRLVGSIKV